MQLLHLKSQQMSSMMQRLWIWRKVHHPHSSVHLIVQESGRTRDQLKRLIRNQRLSDSQPENLKNSRQSLVYFLQRELFWFRKPGIMGNIQHAVVFQLSEGDYAVRAPFNRTESIFTCGCRGRCCPVKVTLCCFKCLKLVCSSLPHTH